MADLTNTTVPPQLSEDAIDQKLKRRSWTLNEELALIEVLKGLHQQGITIDAFRRAALLCRLEEGIKAIIPNSTLKPIPQIKSKICVWTKNYHHLYELMDCSGGSCYLDPETKELVVVDEFWWKDFVKHHPYIESYRNKAFPFFDSWNVIFVRDQGVNS